MTRGLRACEVPIGPQRERWQAPRRPRERDVRTIQAGLRPLTHRCPVLIIAA